MTHADNVQGVFYLSGAGNYVSAMVTLIAALYFVYTPSIKTSIYSRGILIFAALLQIVLSDSKQILLVLACGWLFMVLLKANNINQFMRTLFYVFLTFLGVQLFIWCANNLTSFAAFGHWMNRSELYTFDGDAAHAKLTPFRVIPTYFKSFLHVFIGLGPGHTVSRFARMIVEYEQMLTTLGVTQGEATAIIWDFEKSFWLVRESSIFSPFYFWAGVWGDLGILGLCSYFYLCFQVFKSLITSDAALIIFGSIIALGFIFTQLEEPGFMLSAAMVLGLIWHENFRESFETRSS